MIPTWALGSATRAGFRYAAARCEQALRLDSAPVNLVPRFRTIERLKTTSANGKSKAVKPIWRHKIIVILYWVQAKRHLSQVWVCHRRFGGTFCSKQRATCIRWGTVVEFEILEPVSDMRSSLSDTGRAYVSVRHHRALVCVRLLDQLGSQTCTEILYSEPSSSYSGMP